MFPALAALGGGGGGLPGASSNAVSDSKLTVGPKQSGLNLGQAPQMPAFIASAIGASVEPAPLGGLLPVVVAGFCLLALAFMIRSA